MTTKPETLRAKLTQVFKFLEAFSELRNPVTRLLTDQPWVLDLSNLPSHEAVQLTERREEIAATEDFTEERLVTEFSLTVKRPLLHVCPAPPPSIADWLEAGWQQSSSTVSVVGERRNGEVVERFVDDQSRVADHESWLGERRKWQIEDVPARLADALFQKLFDIQGRFEREGEKFELVLGDGFLSWRLPDGGVGHPLILRHLQMSFDAHVPQFRIDVTGAKPELYMPLLRCIPQIDGALLSKIKSDFDAGDVEPLGGVRTETFLRALVARLSAGGEFVHYPLEGEQDQPRLWRSSVVILRARSLGFQAAIAAILEDIAQGGMMPESLARIVGIELTQAVSDGSEASPEISLPNEDLEILFSKPANAEQLSIAKRLEQFGSVLVQGPPGTGKTYTIGNLISHFLAQKKTVLVTSHSTKALRVVRDQVVDLLQPLCVSVLDRDAEAQKQLEIAVSTISTKLSATTASELRKKATRLAERRQRLVLDLERVRQDLLEARGDEYRDVIVGGVAFSPVTAARRVAAGVGVHDWIPTPVTLGEPCPLPITEVAELYASAVRISSADERELRSDLIDANEILDPGSFRALTFEISDLSQQERDFEAEQWVGQCADAETLSEIAARLVQETQFLEQSEFDVSVIDAGRRGSGWAAVWRELLIMTEELRSVADNAQLPLSRHAPAISAAPPLEVQRRVVREILRHLDRHSQRAWWTKVLHREWDEVSTGWYVGNRQPEKVDEFRAIDALLELTVLRGTVVDRWNRTVGGIGGPSVSADGLPEHVLEIHSRRVTRMLDWFEKVWLPLKADLDAAGLLTEELCRKQPVEASTTGDTMRLVKCIRAVLPRALASKVASLRLQCALTRIRTLRDLLNERANSKGSELLYELVEAIDQCDPDRYSNRYLRLVQLQQLRSDLSRRENLISRLSQAAPTWAEYINNRVPPHGDGQVPGNVDEAWSWRQLYDELSRRNGVSLDELITKSEESTKELCDATVGLVDANAWCAQFERTHLEQQQALHGWSQVMRKIGAGTGKRVPRLQQEARNLMAKCQDAVPVWVMPLSRVVEAFDPRKTRFDVVIVDEASQLDVMGLIALYMGRQAVVVGDNEQVSPDAVGLRADDVDKLIDSQLVGIPNNRLYDGQTSIYDLAEQAFGGAIRLKEHFRCVPEIIEFSNHLSYGGDIKPLREGSTASVFPSTVSYRVDALSVDRSKTNPNEAEAIVSLLIGAIQQPEYRHCTFGVLSLVGDEQAAVIEKMLREKLSPDEIERRRIVCGNAAQFQGDERDVMFLSVVDKPQSGPLAMRQEKRFRQRYNVAASRARDQMWVVHSLRTEMDLKPNDLRRRLIEHATDPTALSQRISRAETKAESEFERRVLRYLVSAGFDVEPQVWVGYYRLDMVVRSGRNAVAVECDGDRFHSDENLREDMARQAVLERLGWRFIRVRGSEFFRDESAAMNRVATRLGELNIMPSGHDGVVSQGRSDIQQRVISAAAALRRRWEEERLFARLDSETFDEFPSGDSPATSVEH
jgi:very-short-patch-repair endonuclease